MATWIILPLQKLTAKVWRFRRQAEDDGHKEHLQPYLLFYFPQCMTVIKGQILTLYWGWVGLKLFQRDC